MSTADSALRCLWRKCRDPGPFNSPKELYEHLDDAHTEYNPGLGFRCRWDGCGRRFEWKMSRHDRARHLITHTQYRPHVCTQRGCRAAFIRKDKLKNHLDTVHREEEDAWDDDCAALEVACRFCDQSFPSASARRTHVSSARHVRPVLRVGGHGVAEAQGSKNTRDLLDVEEWSDEEAFATGRAMGLEGLETTGSSEEPELAAARKRIEELEALLRGRR
ncbi:hypothetical protein AURDEDRAFT_166304 [Auricularia subglabra TFB-10046 SS5]|uniref:C2H2-type domain-containing protein n=1 Tax=Auricularia subglabra (strain TFB-10046 / SS5) TaxID=717982 RepID=J0WXK0_AURST|nr:hypothetical protein AURDEDRAFT_166304 [Auricularia subglabra TFB-10046 SS5]